MKTIEITFSIRDWSKGQDLLVRLGFLPEGVVQATDTHMIHIEDEDMEDLLKEELDMMDLEFETKEIEL